LSDVTPATPAAPPAPGGGDVSLGRLPRVGLHHRLTVVVGSVAIAQTLIGGAALLASARTAPPPAVERAQRSLAAIAALDLGGHVLHPHNAIAQRALDRIAQEPGIVYAFVLDAERVVMSSGPADAGEQHQVDRVTAVIPSEAKGSTKELVLGVRRDAAVMSPGILSMLTGLGITLLVLLPLTHMRLRRWTAGLRHLHVSIRRLSKGFAPSPVLVAGTDEIAYLSLAFNDMAGRMLESQAELVLMNTTLEHRVTDRTEALQRANHDLGRMNRVLNEVTDNALRFADDVAHEFRTPVAVIKEFASLMTEGVAGAVTEKQASYLEFVEQAASELAHLVDDFLDSSKLRAGSMRIDRRPHDVSALLDKAWPLLESRARERGIRLGREVAAGIPPVYADAEKMQRVLVNLVVNAIKFSEENGAVVIAASATEEGDIEFAVRDEGRGMGPEEVANLFQRFRQGSEGVRSSFKGFGLGLSIVREMVDVNLGTVSVTSVPGQGSVFSFVLPSSHPERVVAAFHDRTREQSGRPCTAARVRGENDIESLRVMVIQGMRPHDLVMFAADGRSLIVIGQSECPDEWCTRLKERCAEQSGTPDAGAVEIDPLGSWYPGEPAGGALPALSTEAPEPVKELRRA
jgi:signal transduction histidine kinase